MTADDILASAAVITLLIILGIGWWVISPELSRRR